MTEPAAAMELSRPDVTRLNPASETVTFQFRCLGHSFRARINRSGENAELCVACDVGSLPYSVENRAARRNALMVLSRAGHIADTRLVLSGFHRISLMSCVPLGTEREISAVLVHAATAVLNALPLIGLMADCLNNGAEAA